MCTVLLPPGDNPIAVNKYISIAIIQRDIVMNVHWSSCKVPVNYCQISIKLKFSRETSEKYSNIKFRKNPSYAIRISNFVKKILLCDSNIKFRKNPSYAIRISNFVKILLMRFEYQIS